MRAAPVLMAARWQRATDASIVEERTTIRERRIHHARRGRLRRLRLLAAAPVRRPAARTAPEHAVSAVHWIAAVGTLLLLAYLTCALLKPEWFE